MIGEFEYSLKNISLMFYKPRIAFKNVNQKSDYFSFVAILILYSLVYLGITPTTSAINFLSKIVTSIIVIYPSVILDSILFLLLFRIFKQDIKIGKILTAISLCNISYIFTGAVYFYIAQYSFINNASPVLFFVLAGLMIKEYLNWPYWKSFIVAIILKLISMGLIYEARFVLP